MRPDGSRKSGAPGRPGMRDTYWKHIKDAQAKLSEEHPEATKKEILAMAREAVRLLADEVTVELYEIYIEYLWSLCYF